MSNTKTPRRIWYTYDDDSAPAYIGCSKRQLQRWVQQRRISHTRLGNRTLFAQEHLDAFIAEHTFLPEGA